VGGGHQGGEHQGVARRSLFAASSNFNKTDRAKLFQKRNSGIQRRKGSAVQLSGTQWFFLVFLDFFIRAGSLLVLIPFFPLIFIPLFLSAMHLTILFFVFFVHFWLTPPEKPIRAATAVIAFVTNVIFVGAFVFIWVSFIKSGRQTSCGSGNDCEWINGAITSSGVRTIAITAVIQIVINVIPLMIVGAFKSPVKESAK
jgi:hypothetical protein